jgi:O-antigen/teichoic acid export membrane protein
MASEPEFAGLGESPDKARLLGLFGKIISICFWLSAGVASGLAVAGPWLLALWTHGRVAMDYPLFCWLLATVVSQTMWNGSLALLRGRNEHMSATLFQVATTLCAMGLSAASLAMFHRLWTVGLALFMMDIVFLGFVLRQIHVRYGIRLKQLVYSTLDPGPILMILTSRKYS